MSSVINILHLEDDNDDVELVQTVIESAGFSFRTKVVQSKPEFQQAVEKGNYDIILADFRLPMYDGLSALQLAKEECPDIPFVFVSGTLGEDAAIEALTKGATDYVPKQKLSRLLPAISRALLEAENKRERKRAEDALEASEAELRALVTAMTDVVVVVNAEGRYVKIAETNPSLLYKSPAELLGKTLHEVFPKAQADIFKKYVVRSIEENKAINFEYSLPIGDKNIWFNATISPKSHDEVLLVARDITDRRQAEQKIKENEQLLRTLINSTPDIICFKDGYGHWLEANDSDLELFCLEDINYRGKKDSELAEFTNPIYRQAFLTCESTDEKAWLAGGVSQGEETIPKFDGTYKIYDVIKVPIFEPDGSRKGLVVLGRDITERKLAEESLRQLNRKLRAISDCNQALLRAEDEKTLLDEICNIICNEAGYKMAWVGYAENDADKTIRPVAWAGYDSGYIMNAKLSWSDETEFGRGPAGIAIRTGEKIYVQDFETDPVMSAWRKAALQRGYRSGIALPLKDENSNVFGVLLVYSAEVNSITQDEIELMDELASDLAFGINSLHTRTERNKAVEALKVSEERFSTAFRLSPIAIALFQASTGKFIDVNDTFIKSSGYTRDEVIGRTTEELELFADPKDREIVVKELRETGFVENFEFKMKFKSGVIGYALNSTSVINIGGEPHFLSLILDITERKQAEEALLESEARYRMVFENSPVSIWEEDFSEVKKLFDNLRKTGITDIETYLDEHPGVLRQCADLTKVLDVNKAALELHKATKKEELVANLSDTFTPESFDAFKHELIHLWNGGTEMVRDATVKTLVGDPRDVTVYFTVCPGYENSLTRILVSLTDITDRRKAEETLRHVNEKLRATLEAAPVAIFDLDTEGMVKSIWNNAAEKMLGWSHSEVLGRFLPSVAEDKKEEFKRFLALMQAGKSILGKDLVRQRKDGSLIEYSLYAAPEYDTNNVVMGNIAVLVDITERKKAEAELRRVIHAIEQSPVSVVMTDNNGNIVYVNPKFTETTGYMKEEVYGKNPRILKSGEMKSEEYKKMWDTITIGKEWHGEFHNKKKNGELFWEAASISAVRNESGSITHYVAIKEDITEQKRIQQALENSEELFRTLITAVPDIIIRTDINEKIIYVNESVLRLYTKLPLNKIIGKNLLSFISSKDRQRAEANSKIMFDNRLGLREYRLKFGSGEEIYCEVNSEVLKDSFGQPSGIVYVFRDISARKKAEKELEKYRLHLEELIIERTKELENVNMLLQEEVEKQKEAEQKVKIALEKEKELSDLKSQFISLASHEFRTPLTTVLSSTELLKRYNKEQYPTEYAQLIERIKKSVRHLTDLMDDVLTISRAETGKLKFSSAQVNIEDICSEILEDIKFSLTSNHWINYSKDFKDKLIIIDEKLFKFIVINLLTNAIKYSPDGGEIKFSIKTEAKNLLVEIGDSGIGIPEKDQPYLFEPFHRGSNVSGIHGTGLGMSIIKRSVDMHQGTITFKSVLLEGTVFLVSLPYKKTREK